ncbi:GDP-mannose-dependent alpha-mannosyltransferase [Marinobacterium sp. xm-d-420]|nr:glycosyltransferase family 4 protein [Marinobacterium sp. xm-d-420]NRP28746.1 GDP-mannose-dependent alpha-mannosyltransferase [Marinobacterium sp. xm-d-420]
MKSFFLNHGFENRSVDVLPPIGLELDKISEAHRTQDFNSDCIRLGFLGRMTPEKGILTLIKAVSKVHLPIKIKLVIGGDGPEFEAAKNLSKQLDIDACFLGWIELKENFFNQIDVLVIPSESETFGIVALEAMIRKIPVISTPTNGTKSIINNRLSGLIANDFDDSSLSRAIAELNNIDIQALIAEGHKRALIFNKETVLGRFKAIINKL